MVIDDLHAVAGGPNTGLTSFTFSAVNVNSVAVAAIADIDFWSGSTTAPTSLLYSVRLSFGTMAADSAYTVTYSTTDAAPFFTLPTAGSTIWAGVAFDNNGGAAGYATSAQLANLGQLIYGPPTVGTSANYFYQSTNDYTGPGNDPAGSLLYFGGTPVADFYWSLTAVIPEPSTYMLASCGGIAFLAVGFARKRLGSGNAAGATDDQTATV